MQEQKQLLTLFLVPQGTRKCPYKKEQNGRVQGGAFNEKREEEEKGGEELTKGKVKKGLKRGHGQGQSRANREDLSSLLPSAGLCQRLTSATPSRTQKAREPLVLLSSDPVLGYTGQGEKRRSERQRITSMPERPQPWGKCVLNTTLIVHYCFPWTCA